MDESSERVLWQSGGNRAVCLEPATAEGWVTANGTSRALRFAGRDRLHVLAPVGERRCINVAPCDCGVSR